MEFKRCQLCDKLFASNGNIICSDCFYKLDEVYQKARAAIRDHRNEKISIDKLAEIIGEDEKYIDILIQQERIDLKIKGEENICPMCGAPLKPGDKYCDKCRSSLINGFSGKHKDKEKKFAMFSQERRRR